MKLVLPFFLIILFLTENVYAQNDRLTSKNSLDIQGVGNRGFASIGYNRALLKSRKFEWLVGPAIGYVPSSREDTAHSMPRFVHLNIGTYAVYGGGWFRPTVGLSYSKIILGDPYHARPKSNYNRVLGEIGFLIGSKHSDVAIKLAYTPMLFDDGADDVQNFPFSFAIRALL